MKIGKTAANLQEQRRSLRAWKASAFAPICRDLVVIIAEKYRKSTKWQDWPDSSGLSRQDLRRLAGARRGSGVDNRGNLPVKSPKIRKNPRKIDKIRRSGIIRRIVVASSGPAIPASKTSAITTENQLKIGKNNAKSRECAFFGCSV